MGKKLIIKGADFSENCIIPVMVWNNEYQNPDNDNLLVVASTTNVAGPNYAADTKIDGIKLSLMKKNSPEAPRRNLISGDIINIYLVSKDRPYSKTVIGSYTVTQSDLDNGFAIIPINSIVISSANFLAFGAASLEEGEKIYLPIGVNSGGISGYFITTVNVLTSTVVKGIATYYLQ